MDCTITTPEELVFDGPAKSVVVPAIDGELGFLAKHAPLVSTLGHGELRVDAGTGERQRFFVEGGFVQVLNDRVTVLAVDAVSVSELDANAEKQALETLQGSRPPAGSSFEDLEEHDRKVSVAKTRLRLAGS